MKDAACPISTKRGGGGGGRFRTPPHCSASPRRLREPFLDSLHRHARQTVLVSAIATPEANSVMLRHGAAFRGLLKTREEHKGAIRKVPPPSY